MKIVNAVLFKLNWLACVIGGTLWGALGISALIAFAFYAKSLRQDLPFVLGLAVIGAGFDTTWIALGVLDYGTTIAPVWIIMLWIGLAFTLNHAMSIFAEHPVAGALMAAAAAPMTYFSGQALDAVIVTNAYGLGFVALAWGILFYSIFKYMQRYAGNHPGIEQDNFATDGAYTNAVGNGHSADTTSRG